MSPDDGVLPGECQTVSMSQTAGSPEAARNDAPRAFEIVLHHIESLILDGELRVGDRLPAERELAQQLQVSRPAIREAIRTLEAQGVLASRVGSGAMSGTRVISERSEALGRLLRLQVALSQFPLDEVVVTRIALERSTALMAVEQLDDEGLEALSSMLDDMDRIREPEPFNEADTDFHIRIATVAGNTLVSDLTRAVRTSLRGPILQAEKQMDDWPEFRESLCGQHRGIIEALVARDGALAADRIEEHIRHAYRMLPMGCPLT